RTHTTPLLLHLPPTVQHPRPLHDALPLSLVRLIPRVPSSPSGGADRGPVALYALAEPRRVNPGVARQRIRDVTGGRLEREHTETRHTLSGLSHRLSYEEVVVFGAVEDVRVVHFFPPLLALQRADP